MMASVAELISQLVNLRIPILFPLVTHMLAMRCKNLKIAWIIVTRITVLVVDNLVLVKRAASHRLPKQTVLRHKAKDVL